MRNFMKTLLAAFAVIGYMVTMAQAQDVIKIGATAPITGAFASVYAVQGKLWEAWEKAQNEAGGIYVKSLNKKLPIKIIYYDDKSDPKESVKFYERLIEVDKVDFLLGPPGSPIAFAASTVAERHKFPMILGAAADPQIFARGFKYIQGILAPGTEWSASFFDMLAKQGKVKTVALLVEDSLFSRGVGIGVRDFVKEKGLKLVVDQTVPVDYQDFTSTITQIKQANPDLVYVASFPPFFIRFARQLEELGLNPAALHCATCATGPVRTALGRTAENLTGEVFWVPGMKFGDYRMLERTLEISGVDPIDWNNALETFPALEMIRFGIEKVGTLDRDAVFAAIQKSEITTVMGPFKAMGQGVGTIKPFPVQVQKGKVVVIWPPEIKTADYIYPRRK